MIKKNIKNYNNNFLLKVASYNSLSVFFRLVSGFIVSKFMAIFIGPSGIAITGNLSNFMQSLESLSSLGMKNGVIKYVAENKDEPTKLKQVISSAFFVTLCIALFLSTLLFLFSKSISLFVFDKIEYSFLFEVSALMMPFYTLQVFFISILNGLKKVKELVQINIVGYILTTILIVFLLYREELKGALIAIVLTPFLLFASLFYKFSSFKFIFLNINLNFISKVYISRIGSFFSMTLFSGIMFPIIYLFIRNYLIDNVGVTEAGYWEASRKISNYYMLFIYTLFDLYLLPVLSEDANKVKFRATIFNFYKNVLPIALLGFVLIYFLRFFIIKLVFTDEFLKMNELFGWQLLGDFFRIVSLTMAYQFFAKKMSYHYVICEISLMIFICFSSIYLINHLSVLGAVKAHAFSYIFYTLLMFLVFRKQLFNTYEAK
ncbi:Polysaccharide biosynthesis protein [Mariniflexile rhizosphaerae]|uniref:O-antigen translocase n=1 Tax=unclassified Mariniflexile TaxID=2643887 RepID=UPI000CC1CBE2|nr:O-antigen translocase [Mariniflexile sp. TRM1-10]AXP81726.1 Polysaccharide biosynthesis protein [Mariniflexile sp. TRM1-10]PLB20894.1 MAG: Lipopolysaccharide biosynthesis protein [Flavobacteriaceae bacterium FS1-H7996/R]